MIETRLERQGLSDRIAETASGMRTTVRRWRWRSNPPWEGFGEPLNGQQFRRRTIDLLFESFQPDALIETGTFMCFTTRYLAAKGVATYTAEVDPGYGWLAARTLNGLDNVTLLHGDSAAALERLAEAGRIGRPLVYLDAHWEERLPLQDEVKLLFSRWDDMLAVVDDFKVPGMPGYGYDTYNGAPMALEEVDVPLEAIVAYPAIPPEQETGSRRGAVYLGHGKDARVALEAAATAGLVSFQATVR